MSLATISGAIACLSYALAAFLIIRCLRLNHPIHQPQLLTLTAIGLISQGLQLHLELFVATGGVRLGVTTMASLFGFVLALSSTFIALYRQVIPLLSPVLPTASFSALIAALFPDTLAPVQNLPSGILIHILLSITAYCLITLALSQAVLIWVQNRQLKHRTINAVIGALPPLQTMEKTLFEMIMAGLAALGLAIGLGFFVVDDIFAQHLAHKTAFSIGAWCVLLALVLGRRWRGWRGMVAVRWTLSSFILLTLGYFGSKVVLEFILQRA